MREFEEKYEEQNKDFETLVNRQTQSASNSSSNK